MALKFEVDDVCQYLVASDIIDYDSDNIQQLASSLSATTNSDIDLAKKAYEYVRDNIPHSFDINGDIVTCTASKVLQYNQGICYAKSHLLAAILRCLDIPAGFCYQKLVLDDADKSLLTLHGLNAIFLKSIHKWIRVDARGNKPGVKAEFNIDKEMLAFSVKPEWGEVDYPTVYAQPNKNVVQALKKSNNRQDLVRNLPFEL